MTKHSMSTTNLYINLCMLKAISVKRERSRNTITPLGLIIRDKCGYAKQNKTRNLQPDVPKDSQRYIQGKKKTK